MFFANATRYNMAKRKCENQPNLKSGDDMIFVIIDGTEVLAVSGPEFGCYHSYQHQGIDKGEKERWPTQTVKLEDVAMTWTCSLT